jgi:hypothetical protein
MASPSASPTLAITVPPAELGGVLEQVADHLRDARLVRVDEERARGLDAQLETTTLEQRPMVVAGPARDLAQVEAPASQLDLAARDPGHVEEIVDEAGEVLGLALDDLPCQRGLLAAGLHTVEQEQAVLDGGERVPELVRQDGDELVLPRFRRGPERERALQLLGAFLDASLQAGVEALEPLLRRGESFDERLVPEAQAGRFLEGAATAAGDPGHRDAEQGQHEGHGGLNGLALRAQPHHHRQESGCGERHERRRVAGVARRSARGHAAQHEREEDLVER